MEDRSKALSEKEAIARIKGIADAEELQLFMTEERRHRVLDAAHKRNAELDPDLPPMVIDINEDQQAEKEKLDNTTMPRTEKEAAQVKAEAKANRPANKPVPPIVSSESKSIERKIAAMLIKQFAQAVNMKIGSIWNAYNEAIAFNDDDRKFKYNVGVRCSITGDDPNTYSVDVRLTWSVKETIEITGMVKSNEDLPGGMDLVDQMEASGSGEDDDEEDEDAPPADEEWRKLDMKDKDEDVLKAILDSPDASAAEVRAAREELALRKSSEMGGAAGGPPAPPTPKKRGRKPKAAAANA